MKRTYLASSLILTVSAVAFSMQGCNPGQTLAPLPAGGGDEAAGGDVSGNGGGGGEGTTGGTAATSNGGGNSNGGTTAATATGGSTTVAGPTGGKASGPTGGSPSGTGGARPTGGAVTVGTGGMVTTATGGMVTVATGGMVTVATGGMVTVATGGATAVGNTGKTVTISSSGKASGAMTGWASVALGTADTITDPTCGTTKAAITNAAPCNTTTNWSASGICMSGSIPALAATNPDYTGNWGISVGVGATDPAGGGLGQSFTSVTITVTGTPTTGLRAVVHRVGDPVSTTYCAALTSGTAITFTTFAVDCYNGTAAVGPFITAADVPNIDNISVQVSSTSSLITVTNLCIASITFT